MYDNGQSYTRDGRVIPSLRAMVKANGYAHRVGSPQPYPNLLDYYSEEAIQDHATWQKSNEDQAEHGTT